MAPVKMHLMPHAQDLDLTALPDQDHIEHAIDLVAALPAGAPVIIAPGGRAPIPTGLVIYLPPGTEAQIRPRSGLALHYGVTVLNASGTLDARYHGELHVILINLGKEAFKIERGTRIALLVFAPVPAVKIEWPAQWE